MCSSEEYANPGNFAMIAKISLGLRKFRNHSENFAILAKLRNFARIAKLRNFARIAKLRNFARIAKLRNFARIAKFRYIAKITVPSEIIHFRYL